MEKRKRKNHESKSKFKEFLEMELTGGGRGVGPSAEEDLEMERRLAKKLRVKKNGLIGGGFDDGLDELLQGFPSVIEEAFEHESKEEEKKKNKKNKNENFAEFEEGMTLNDKGGTMKEKKKKDGSFDELEEEGGGLKENRGKLNEKKKKNETLGAKSGKELVEGDDYNKKYMNFGDGEIVLETAVDSDAKKRKKKKSVSKKENLEEDEKEKEKDSEEEETDCGDGERKGAAVDTSAKYVAPHLRACSRSESEEISRVRRSVRGLLNRLSESNFETITQEVASIFQSVSRNVGCQIIGEEVLAFCIGGPRGSEQYAAVFSAFVAGMACLVGIDFSAKLLASLAKSFEEEYSKKDGLSLRNLTLLLSYLCNFGVCSSDLIYDLLSILSMRLTELDVSTILTILQCCGMKLRRDDPTAMKDFVLGTQRRVNELKALCQSTEVDKPKIIESKRMEFMLETICDIKNNKKTAKEDPSQHTRIKKWLQKLRSDNIVLHGITWSKLLDSHKKGQWWFSGDTTSTADDVKQVANAISKEVLEAQKLVQLAAAQRMNTDVRRAIFCIIMSAEDYVDAFEKILRLSLSGKQDREIMRVLVDCCLQEKVFNKYYTVLASKFCSHDKNHKFTLQYCIWDRFKELDSMDLNPSMNLARFVAEMLSSFTLPPSALKTVDLMDPNQLTPKRIMHFRMLFETLFESTDALIWNIFTRIAGIPELETLRDSLVFFIKQYVVSSNHGKSLAGKFKIMKKALQNEAGVLI